MTVLYPLSNFWCCGRSKATMEMAIMKYWTVVLVTVMMIACSTMEVSSEHDKSVNFSLLKTYLWEPQKHKSKGKPSARYQFLDTQVRAAVDSRLAAKGYEKKLSGNPDFLIRYHVRVQIQTDNDELSHWAQWRHRIGPVDEGLRPDLDTTQVSRMSDYEEGTLILVISDGKYQRSIWRGTAKTRVVASDSQEKKKSKINKAVTSILAQFPP